MGQEIVYCFKCATRLLGADFEKGRAVRAGNRAACKDCAADLLASIPPEERPEPTPPKDVRLSSSTRMKALNIPSSTPRVAVQKISDPPNRTGLYLLLGVIGLGAVAVAIFAAGGSSKTPVVEEARREVRPTFEKPPIPASLPTPEKPRPGEAFDKEVAKLREKARSEAEAAKKDPAPPADPPKVEKPPPGPPSEEAKSYRAAWQAAVLRAGARQFEAAAADMARAAQNVKEEAVRNEAAADAEDFRLFPTVYGAALRALASTPMGQALELEVRDDKGLRVIKGRVDRAGTDRLVLVGDDGRRIYIDWSDVAARSLAATRSTGDARRLALFCLLEGDVDAAHAYGDDLPEKYLAFAPEAAAKVPRPSAREVEARRLLGEAEAEFARMETLGPAAAKFKSLLVNYADTAIVRSENALLRRRAEAGAEYLFCGSALKAEGTFRPATPPKVEVAWVSSADSDRGTFVEAEFYALSEATYRCWVYVGGCCAETLTFYYQTTDASDVNPRTKQRESIEPGAGIASPAKPSISNLKKTHALHAKNKEPKAPERWEWVSIPLPKYSTPGLKKLRLITDQQGFGVAAIFVTATRSTPPSEAELKEDLGRSRPPGAGAAPAPASGKPWRALFDGKTLDCMSAGTNGWRVEKGAIERIPNPNVDALQAKELLDDGEVRIRFEVKNLQAVWFRFRQEAAGYSVRIQNADLKALEGGVHELVAVATGDQVTATLDGKAVAVAAEGNPRRGHVVQFSATEGTFRVLAIDVR